MCKPIDNKYVFTYIYSIETLRRIGTRLVKPPVSTGPAKWPPSPARDRLEPRSLSETDFTGWPWRQGQTGNQPDNHTGNDAMENEIVSGAWKGHLGQGLAPRELQCVLSVAQGMTAKEIAKLFGVTPGTIGKRIEAAMFKLGVHRRGALVAEAMKRQIISPMCLLLAALLAMNAVTSVGSNDPQRRERRPSHTRIAQARVTRKSETLERDV